MTTAAEDEDIAALTVLNQDYIASVQRGDVRRFDEILAADFLCSNPDGTLIDRAQFLAQTARPVTITGLVAEDVQVRLFGDLALIHARTRYRTADGEERQGRYTDAWAQHAVAHVMEMQGRTTDGIAWMRSDIPAWTEDNFFAVHNWWHLALYHLEIGEVEEVLRLFDGPIHGARSCVMIDMIDAAALLWRLHLRGVDVGERWQTVADGFAPTAGAGNYAFNDLHAMMAFTGAGRRDLAEHVLAAQRAAMEREDDNAAFTREVGHAATRAIQAFGNEQYSETISLIRGIRSTAHRFGGSHAQRDVLDLTLLEAAFRSGQHDLAKALTAERVAAKPASPLAALFARRAHYRQYPVIS